MIEKLEEGKAKTEVLINGRRWVLLHPREYAGRIPTELSVPKGTRIITGREKGTGRRLMLIHSEALAALVSSEACQ